MAEAKRAASPLYLGLDFSTQQLKAVCVDEQLTITHEFSVAFDEDLPEFKSLVSILIPGHQVVSTRVKMV
jgi:xylulokinase